MLKDIKFINGEFVAVGELITISKDGISWNIVKKDINHYYCINYKGKKIVVIGEKNIYSTYDLINWEELSKSDFIDNYKQIIHNGKYYLLIGNSADESNKSIIYKSIDLLNWEEITRPNISINNIFWDGKTFYLGSDDGLYKCSLN